MESKTKLVGHAVHPMLIVFPIGLLAMSVVFDVITLVTSIPKFSEAGFYMMISGVFSGMFAAIFGLIDFLAIPRNTRAKEVGAYHGIANVSVVLLFALSFILRWKNPGQPPVTALMLSFAGAALTMIGGWLGAELVERHGIGVYHGANVDASSSLNSLTETPNHS